MVEESDLVYVDVETTGLDPYRHEVWEIGLIIGESKKSIVIRPDVTLEHADPKALRVNHYYTRSVEKPVADRVYMQTGPRTIASLTQNKTLVGVNTQFDQAFLWHFLKNNGLVPAWNQYIVDVVGLAAGLFGVAPPWSSHDLSRELGIDPDDYARHTAVGDAQWARDMYLKIMEYQRD